MADEADLNAHDLAMFQPTASSYRGQAGELDGAAKAVREPLPGLAGGIRGTAEMIAAFTTAFTTAGTMIEQGGKGLNAYAGATESIGNEYINAHSLSSEVLSSILNANDRAARATGQGPI
jgi:hypothetical protein